MNDVRGFVRPYMIISMSTTRFIISGMRNYPIWKSYAVCITNRSMEMSFSKLWKAKQKKKVLGMLKALIQKIENDELSVTSHGFWLSHLDNKVFFKIETVSRDSNRVSGDFRKFS